MATSAPTWIKSGYPPNALVFQQNVEDDFTAEELARIKQVLTNSGTRSASKPKKPKATSAKSGR